MAKKIAIGAIRRVCLGWSASLLHGVGQFMGQQLLARWGVGLVVISAEHNIPPSGVGKRTDGLRRLIRCWACVEADTAEIRAKQRLEIAPLLVAEALAACDRVDCGFGSWGHVAFRTTFRGTCGFAKQPCGGLALGTTATAGAARACGRIRHSHNLLGHAVRFLFVDITR